MKDAFVTLSNPKHAQDIISLLWLERAKPAAAPGANLICTEQSLALVTDGRKELYATCVEKGIYVGVDRCDLRWAIKDLARRMTEPRECDIVNLKMFRRCLKRSPHVGWITKLNTASGAPSAALTLEVYANANFGRSPGMDRRSTDCAVVIIGGSVVHA